jgi:hypothetical protein
VFGQPTLRGTVRAFKVRIERTTYEQIVLNLEFVPDHARFGRKVSNLHPHLMFFSGNNSQRMGRSWVVPDFRPFLAKSSWPGQNQATSVFYD